MTDAIETHSDGFPLLLTSYSTAYAEMGCVDAGQESRGAACSDFTVKMHSQIKSRRRGHVRNGLPRVVCHRKGRTIFSCGIDLDEISGHSDLVRARRNWGRHVRGNLRTAINGGRLLFACCMWNRERTSGLDHVLSVAAFCDSLVLLNSFGDKFCSS